MNNTIKKNLNITDGGIVFLISVTLLICANLLIGFLVQAEMFTSSNYYYIIGAAELIAVGLPPVLYMIIKKISFRSIFKKKLSIEQAALSVFIAIFAYPVFGFIRLLWMIGLDAINIPFLGQTMPIIDSIPIFLVAVVVVSLIPGFAEEIVFRGIIQDTYQRRYKPIKAILLTSIFFMLMHADVYSWTFTFAAGAMLGLVYYITESLWASIIFHAVNNFIGVAVNYIYSLLGYEELLEGSTDLFLQSEGMIVTVILMLFVSLFCSGIVVLLIWALKKVSSKPEVIILRQEKLNTTSYLPYIIGGFLMVVVAILPIIIAALTT